MVSYTTFVRLAFDEVRRKGKTFDGIDDGGDFMEEVGAAWQQNKEELKQKTEQQTRNWLNERVSA